jgi:hypothetical protein
MIPDRSLTRDASENGVSSRVEACRKRLRLIRGNQKAAIEAVVSAGIQLPIKVEVSTEVSHRLGASEIRAERMDEAGIT